MVDQLLGLLLIGLGLKTPKLTPRPAIMGEQTELVTATEEGNDSESSTTSVKMTVRDQKETEKKRLELGREQQKKIIETAKTNRKNVQEMLDDQKEFASKSTELLRKKEKEAEEYHNKIEAFKEETQKKIEASRQAFEKRVAALKDERKKEQLQKLNTLIAKANTNRIDVMTKHIERLNEVIAKITTKTQELKKNGVDTTTVDTAVATAQTAITAAKTAIEAQAKKGYVIGITTEANAANDVGRTRTQLEKDLAAVNNTIIQARQSVSGAISALAKLAGVGINAGKKDASQSATP